MAITAPFRFARINRWVHFPIWADAVSHDLPFEDGYCGEFAFTLTNRTPLLLGGARRKSVKQGEKSGEVWPFVDADGRLTIPGSSIQGMIRSILEVATFAKLGPWVAKSRFGVRDLTGKSVTADQLYKKQMTGTNKGVFVPQSKAAWIRPDGKGGAEILTCKLARIEMSEIASGLTLQHLMREGKNGPTLTWKDAPGRYGELLGIKPLDALDRSFDWPPNFAGPHWHSPGQIQYDKCIAAGYATSSSFNGTVVLTGKTSSTLKGDGKPTTTHKHMEFVFYSPCRTELGTVPRSDWQPVPPNVWTDFLLIHDQNTGKNAQPNPNWEFWKGEFEAGRPVPVFTLEKAGAVTDIGTAQMFKLAMELSTHDLLNNSSPDHLDASRFDLPSLIFGATGGEGGKDAWFAHNLKRRASFDMVRGPAMDELRKTDPETLLAPKPNYYPIYVRQVPETGSKLADGVPYAAYHKMPGPDRARTKPELSGVKLWPSNRQDALSNRTLRPTESAITNFLNLVPKGTAFTGIMRFHNLKAVELGAVLWALTFGDKHALPGGEEPLRMRHRIGLAKPLGAGEIEIKITGSDLQPNQGGAGPALSPADCIDAFVKHMTDEYKVRKPGASWIASPQVKALHQAADPDCNAAVPRSYMKLEGYRDERAANSLSFLPAYASAPDHEIEPPAPSVVERMLADAADQFPKRMAPPELPPAGIATEAFSLGDPVRNTNNGRTGFIAAYPEFRPHPLEPKKAKWIVGIVGTLGNFDWEDTQQGKLQKL